jgi:hypothetical protein
MKDIFASTYSLLPSDPIAKSTSSLCKWHAKSFCVHPPTWRVSRRLSCSESCRRVHTLGGETAVEGDHVAVSDRISLRADYVVSWSSRRIHWPCSTPCPSRLKKTMHRRLCVRMRPGDNLRKPTRETGNDSPFHLLFHIFYLYYFIHYGSN